VVSKSNRTSKYGVGRKRGQCGGLYIHIPFCVKKCIYCDFYSIVNLSRIPRFLDALEREMGMRRGLQLTFDSVYIGGGTPSVLDAGDIGRLVETAWKQFDILPDSEITLEANPGTLCAEDLKAYRQCGINRLNIGVQSFHRENLGFLGRIHSGRQALEAIQWARQAGFDNIGLDLIYGLPGQTRANWLADLQRAVDLAPEHLSCYMLTRESGTPLDREIKAGHLKLPADSTMRALFDITIDFLKRHGFFHYEISNFARLTEDGHSPWISRHNKKYWTLAPYLGLGPSAHSFIDFQRWWNHRSVQKYVQQIETGRLPTAQKEKLTKEQLIMEAIYLGFRTAAGINTTTFEDRFGMNFFSAFKEPVAGFEKDGFLAITETRCALTRKGMAYLDSISAAFTSQDFNG